ncbi:MAG: hypothetical protein DCC67_09100 [Planctomycetota bacterium]|nr:MAG: hypothetical protein DCC67_09100 [Planctomycetota bacterium]
MNIKAIGGGVGLAIAALLWAWALGWFSGDRKAYSEDPKVAELERLRDENMPKMDQFTEAQRRKQGEQFREKMQGLTPEQRMAFFESSMPVLVPMMARGFEKRYDQFMKLSPEEQRKELDKHIDAMEARGGTERPAGEGGRGPGNIDPKKADEFRKKMLAWTTPSQRAKFENGIQLLNDRRKQRGLPPIGGPGGGFF